MLKKISKGKKGTTCNTDLEMERIDNNRFDLTKGGLGLILNFKQANDLKNWLISEITQVNFDRAINGE